MQPAETPHVHHIGAHWTVDLTRPEPDAPLLHAPRGLAHHHAHHAVGQTMAALLGDGAREVIGQVLAAVLAGRMADARATLPRAHADTVPLMVVADPQVPGRLHFLDITTAHQEMPPVDGMPALETLASPTELAVVLGTQPAGDRAVLHVSRGAHSLIGHLPEELYLLELEHLVHPQDLEALRRAIGRCADRTAHATSLQLRLRHAEGYWRPVLGRVARLSSEPLRVVVHLRADVRQRRPAGHSLWLAAAPKVPDAVQVLDRDGAVLLASDGVAATFGADVAPDRSTMLDLCHPADRRRVARALERGWRAEGGTASVAWRIATPEGQWRFVETRISGRLHDPAVQGVILTTRDVTWRELFDAPTGLPGRALLLERTEAALREAAGTTTALAFFDMDRFSTVADALGQPEADRILHQIARRLADGVRPSDSVARLGTDRFAVLLSQLCTHDDAVSAATRLRHLVEAPVKTAEGHMVVTATVGLAISTAELSASDALLAASRAAMRRGKRRGGARVEVHAGPQTTPSRRTPHVHAELLHALDHHELRVYYQPLVQLQTGGVFGYEALVRWHHPTRGVVPPDEFIPVAEKTGLIGRIGAWVLGEACRTVAGWSTHAETPPSISVNMSARQLRDDDVVGVVQSALHTSGLAPEQLCLELTETALLDDDGHTATTLANLRTLGARLALDDFGAGYSSLSHLRRYRLDTLKIDRSFVALLGTDEVASAIVPSMLHLANALGLDVVAEGIETAQQRTLLQSLGCLQGQGFLFAAAMPEHRIEQLYIQDQPPTS